MVAYIPLFAYAIAFLFVGLFLFFGKPIFRYLFNAGVVVGLASNIFEFALRFFDTGNVQTSTLYDFLIMLSGAFALTYLIIYFKYRRPMIGMFLIPFPLVCSILALYAPITEPSEVVSSLWRYLHLPFIILGSTFFVSSFFASLMYFLQERQLKTKSFGFVFKRFPPLNTINKIIDMTLQFGVSFFTAGAFFGFMWVSSSDFSLSSTVKILLSIVAWFIFAAILYGKHKEKITPRQTALFTIAGFLAMLISYIGVIVFLVG